MPHKLYLNEEETIAVTVWENGEVTIATREDRDDVWGPPIRLTEKQSY